MSKGGSGGGRLTSTPAAISCGATCAALFNPGTVVTLSGTAAGGSKPVAWAGCDAIVGADECQVTLAATKAVTATFDLVPSDNGGGSSDNGGSSGSGGSGGSSGSGSTATPAPKPAVKPLQCKKGFKEEDGRQGAA